MAQEMICPACAGTGKVGQNNITALRKARGLRQHVLARELGMTQGGYSHLERRGGSWMREWDQKVIKLAKFFGVDGDVIRDRAPIPEKKASTSPRPRRSATASSVAKSKRRRTAVAKKNKSGRKA